MAADSSAPPDKNSRMEHSYRTCVPEVERANTETCSGTAQIGAAMGCAPIAYPISDTPSDQLFY